MLDSCLSGPSFLAGLSKSHSVSSGWNPRSIYVLAMLELPGLTDHARRLHERSALVCRGLHIPIFCCHYVSKENPLRGIGDVVDLSD